MRGLLPTEYASTGDVRSFEPSRCRYLPNSGFCN